MSCFVGRPQWFAGPDDYSINITYTIGSRCDVTEQNHFDKYCYLDVIYYRNVHQILVIRTNAIVV